MTGHDSHELDDRGRCLHHPAVRSRHEREAHAAELAEGNAFDVARLLRFHAHTLRSEADSLDSVASHLEHRYLNGERSDA